MFSVPFSRTGRGWHPLVKPSYLLRVIACLVLLVFHIVLRGEALLSPATIWLPITGILWPHLALYLSAKSADGKAQECCNMHVDCALVALTCITTPNLFYWSATFSILVLANSLYVGSYPLLLKNTLIFVATVAAGRSLSGQVEPLNLSAPAGAVLTAFLCFYMGFLSRMSYKMAHQLIHLNKRVHALSITDRLTGCFNRLYLEEKLPTELRRSQRIGYSLAAIFADIDHFKQINDRYGHAGGDAVLRQFIARVEDTIRTGVDWVARYGGEEFVIVLPNTSPEQALVVAERIRLKIADTPFLWEDQPIEVTCSFGVAATGNRPPPQREESTHQDLLAAADASAYEAKRMGRNRCVLGSR